MFRPFFTTTSKSIFPLFVLAGLMLTVGCGDSNRSPFAPTPVVESSETGASKSATDVNTDPNSGYEIPKDDESDYRRGARTGKPVVVEQADEPAGKQTVRENDNGIPAPEAGTDEKENGN